jgi:hypothetical protein
MDFRSGSAVPVFRRHATIINKQEFDSEEHVGSIVITALQGSKPQHQRYLEQQWLLTYGKNNINSRSATGGAAAVDLIEWKSKWQNILNSFSM